MSVVVLAEDGSDVESLRHLIRRICGDESLSVKGKAYDGGPHLFRKAARDIRMFHARGFVQFVLCHDADGVDYRPVAKRIDNEVVAEAGVDAKFCITVPVQEIEAWLIADPDAMNRVLPKFGFAGHANPEAIESPKEWLVRKSRDERRKPLYVPRVFNPRVAAELSVETVAARCPSFERFRSAILTWFS